MKVKKTKTKNKNSEGAVNTERKGGVCSCSVVSDSATPWAVAHQAPLSVGFSRQEHWSGLPFPSPGDLPDPGMEPCLPSRLHCRLMLYHRATWKEGHLGRERGDEKECHEGTSLEVWWLRLYIPKAGVPVREHSTTKDPACCN